MSYNTRFTGNSLLMALRDSSDLTVKLSYTTLKSTTWNIPSYTSTTVM